MYLSDDVLGQGASHVLCAVPQRLDGSPRDAREWRQWRRGLRRRLIVCRVGRFGCRSRFSAVWPCCYKTKPMSDTITTTVAYFKVSTHLPRTEAKPATHLPGCLGCVLPDMHMLMTGRRLGVCLWHVLGIALACLPCLPLQPVESSLVEHRHPR